MPTAPDAPRQTLGPLSFHFLDGWHASSHEGSGTAVGIQLLARGLRSEGHEVTVHRPFLDRSGGAAPASAEGTGSVPFRSRIAYNLGLPRRLRRIPSGHVVVGFDLDGWRWSSRRPHGSSYFVALKGVAADEARYARTRSERWFLEALARLERRNASAADAVLVTSRHSAEVAAAHYGLPESRFRVLPEPIDGSLWEKLRTSAPARADRPTILSVARQYPRKDTATLLRALRSVRAAVPDVHLRIIGGGPELPRLRRLAGTLDLTGSVTFHGALPDDAEVRRSYFEADLFCLPSRQEGFGIVFLEAMAAGLPIVAARTGAVPEVVPEGEVGLLVPPGDPEALAAAILQLLRDPDARRRMGGAGLHRAEDFDLRRVVRTFLDIVHPSRQDPGS